MEKFFGFYFNANIHESGPSLVSLHKSKIGAEFAMHKFLSQNNLEFYQECRIETVEVKE